MRKLWLVGAIVLLSVVLGATVLREPVAWAASNLNVTIIGPLDGDGNVKVHDQGTVTVAGSVEVTNDPPTQVVLRSPTSGDQVLAGSPRFYIFDTTALSAVRVGFSSLSGTENCQVEVIIDSFTVREWNINAEFVDVSDVFQVPSRRVIVRVESSSVCWALVGAYGTPIA